MIIFFSINMTYSVGMLTCKKREEYIFFFLHLEEYAFFSSLGTVYFSFHLVLLIPYMVCTSLIIISILTFLVYRDHGEYRNVYS